MRMPRIKAPLSHPKAHYHIVSRVVDRRQVLHAEEKEHFISLMRKYETFCDVRVLSFCILSNHFHILVQVLPPPKILPSIEELIQRVEDLGVLNAATKLRKQLALFTELDDQASIELLRKSLLDRMWDISVFIKELKQRFSFWFNKKHQRKGTLWEERFRSVLVEGAGHALASMAAYIDLNPVRARIVCDPKDYRWSSYSEAMASRSKAMEGLRHVIAGLKRVDLESITVTTSLADYRLWMYSKGEQMDGVDVQGRPSRLGIQRDVVSKMVRNKGRVSVEDYVTMRVRYLVDGKIVGGRDFVEGIFQSLRHRFGKNRKTGARRMRGVESEELYCIRDLKLRLFD